MAVNVKIGLCSTPAGEFLAQFSSEAFAVVGEFGVDGTDVLLRFFTPESVAEEFESAVRSEESVAELRRFSSDDDEAYFQARTDQSASEYYSWIHLGGQFLAAEPTRRGWTVEIQFPDRNAVSAYVDRCEDGGRNPTILKLRQSAEADPSQAGPTYPVTESQRELLLLALERGYFEVPRRTTLESISGELSISSQAASERLRRGLNPLVQSLGEL